MRILVAEDDAVSRRTLEQLLVSWGHEPVLATDGQEAWEALQREDCPRMAILDWTMPRMAGVEVCQRVRESLYERYVYIVLLTGRSQRADILEGMNAGADDYIVKPFDSSELALRIRAGERLLALQTRDLAIFAMAKLAESRDPETGAHLERVRGYCKVVAECLAGRAKFRGTIDPTYVRTLYLTSPLHDIGKIAIPDTILLKPGRLSDREFEVMKSHATRGAETLDAALREYPEASFLVMARDIAATHHERFDGTGYPAGLVGTDIPLCGRIAALADVYDALSSKRVYKAAETHEVARSIVASESGSHFDPDVVEAFLQTEQQFLGISERYKMAEAAA